MQFSKQNIILPRPMAAQKPHYQEIQFSKNLRELLLRRGHSISGVAKKIGMNKTTLHNYVHGGMPRNVQSLAKLAHFLEIPLDELFYGGSSKNKARQSLEGRYELLVREIGD